MLGESAKENAVPKVKKPAPVIPLLTAPVGSNEIPPNQDSFLSDISPLAYPQDAP